MNFLMVPGIRCILPLALALLLLGGCSTNSTSSSGSASLFSATPGTIASPTLNNANDAPIIIGTNGASISSVHVGTSIAPTAPRRGLRGPRQPTRLRHAMRGNRALHAGQFRRYTNPAAQHRAQQAPGSFRGYYNPSTGSIMVGPSAPAASGTWGNPGAGAPIYYDPTSGAFSFQ